MSDGNIDLDVGELFANRDGTVSGGSIVDIAADSMLNTGIVSGTAGLFVETTSDLLNEGGSLLSEGNIGLNVGGQFANRDGTVSGSGIVGITADSMVNTGAITGIGGLAVQTVNNLLNWGGSLQSEGDIGLNVGGQFANRSGTVAGGGNVSISAAEILNETEVTRERTGDGFVDRIGQVATIAAGGELNLQADGAIRSIGGALKSGGDTTLNAGGDIEIAAVELQSEQRRSSSGGQDNRRSVTHELATIETGGNLQVTAGGDLTVRGATVEAGGDATLYAVGDTTIESVQDRRWSATRQGSDRRTETSTETQRTTIRAGGELTVGARTGDVTLDAVSLASGGDTNLVAEQGTVSLLTETDESGSTSFRRRSSRLEWSETDQGRSQETIEHVELEYGGELRISAGEGVVVEYERAGSLSASLNELTDSPELAWMDELRGDGDVEWQGVEASSESWYRSSSGLTAAGKAAAAQAAAESQKSVAGSEDPGVSSLRVYGAGLPSAAGGGGGGGQLLAGVQGVPRNTIRPLPDPQPKDSSGSESGSSQGGTTGGSDTSTLTLKTVDITEPAPLPYDPYAPWLFGSGYTTHPSGEGTTETVTIGLVDIELPTSNTGSDGNGAGGGYDFWSEFYTTGTGTSAGSGRDGQQTSVLPWLSPWSIGGFLAPLGGFGLTAGWVPGSGDPAPGGGVMHPPVGQGQGRDLIDLSGGQDATGADLIDLSGGFVGIGQDLPEFEIPQTGADVIRLTGDDVGIGQDLPGTIEIGDPGAEFCTFMSWYCPQLGPEAGSETPGLTIYANEPAGQEGQNAQGGGQETVSSGRATDPTQTGQPSDTSSNGDQGTAAVNEYGDASGGGQNVADGGNQSTWTSTGTKTGIENAVSHWNKHEDEFPKYENAEQYFDGALDVVNNPPEGTLTKTAANGDNLIYDPISNTFAVQSSNGQIRTMFRPSDGLDYWNRQ